MKGIDTSPQGLVHLQRSIKITVFLIVGFLLFGWSLAVAHAADAPPVVVVDGRAVTVEGTQAFVNGSQVPFSDLAVKLGSAPTPATNIELFTTTPPTTTLPATGVQAVVQGNHIQLINLTKPLAFYGRIGIWISGSGNGFTWRICIIISWGSVNNPTVVVDDHEVTVGDVQAEIDGQAVEFHQVADLLKGQVTPVDKIELATTGVPTTSLPADGVTAIMEGNRITVTNLSGILAQNRQISIWISGSRWRVCIIITWGSNTDLVALVDGHEATIEGVKAQIDGQDVELRRLLALLGPNPVTAKQIELATTVAPTQTLPADGVQATLEGNQIQLTHLTQALANYGRIAIWIGSDRWRICIIIRWGNADVLKATVDGHEVPIGGVKALLDGQLVDLRRILALVGDSAITPTVEVATTGGVTLTVPNAQAVLAGHKLMLTNLDHTLATYGRLAIWISGKNWRVCILIDDFFSNTNLKATVDGRDTTVTDVQAEVDGQMTDVRRVLALLGDQPVTADKIELSTVGAVASTTNAGIPLPADGVQAVVQGNQITLTHLSETLAKYGRISIWISGARWRICIIISWGSDANLTALVDGREATIEEVKTEVDGQSADLRRVLALLNGVPTPATKIELATTGTPTKTLPATNVQAVVQGSELKFTNLAPLLATYGRISIWISGSNWRICIIISWGSSANLEARVDGREVNVESILAQIDGQTVELRRVLALLGPNAVTANKVDLFTTPPPTQFFLVDNVQAVVQGNQIKITNLANTLATYKRIGIWISGERWRICIIITLGTDNNPRVVVDGRAVTAYNAQAELDGQPVEPRRVFALLGAQKVAATKIELATTKAPTQTLPSLGVQALVGDNHIELTNLSNTLAQYGRISIWISGSNWRICIIISWGKFTSSDGQVKLDLPALDAHTNVDVHYTVIPTPTHPLTSTLGVLRHFRLEAADDGGLPVTQFDANYALVVHYTDEELAAAGISEDNLTLAYWDEKAGKWVPLPTLVDKVNNIATTTLNHFTEFTLFGPKSATSPQSIFLPLINR